MKSDQAIIQGCLAGDRSSWDAFVERFSKLIYWSIHRAAAGTAFRQRPDFVDDIFQELFRRLLEKEELSRLRRVESVRKFLSVMACHMTVDRMRHLRRAEKNVPLLDLDDEDNSVIGVHNLAADSDPATELLSRERREIIEKALRGLSEKERACIELHYLYDKTHKDIAAALGFPQDTVSSIIRRTRDKLERHLSRKGLKDF